MNAFQVRIFISVFISVCSMPLTLGPSSDHRHTRSHTGPGWDRWSRAGRRVHLSITPWKSYKSYIYMGATSVPDGRPFVIVGLAWSCCRDTLYTRLHDYSGVWRVHWQHCCRSACQTPGDHFNPKLHNHELREFAGGRLSGIGAVPRL